jgi:hypothetical protein
MVTIINKIAIDLITIDTVTVTLPYEININELHYKIEYNPEYSGVPLFLNVVDGKEKSILIMLNDTGINKSALNPNNLFKTENFKVEKIIFNCYRNIELSFTLERQVVKKMCE